MYTRDLNFAIQSGGGWLWEKKKKKYTYGEIQKYKEAQDAAAANELAEVAEAEAEAKLRMENPMKTSKHFQKNRLNNQIRKTTNNFQTHGIQQIREMQEAQIPHNAEDDGSYDEGSDDKDTANETQVTSFCQECGVRKSDPGPFCGECKKKFPPNEEQVNEKPLALTYELKGSKKGNDRFYAIQEANGTITALDKEKFLDIYDQ